MRDTIEPTKFRFLANNTDGANGSGTALWEVPRMLHGEWVQHTLSIGFSSFREAFAANEALLDIFKAGREVGYADAQRRVLTSLGEQAKEG